MSNGVVSGVHVPRNRWAEKAKELGINAFYSAKTSHFYVMGHVTKNENDKITLQAFRLRYITECSKGPIIILENSEIDTENLWILLSEGIDHPKGINHRTGIKVEFDPLIPS